MASDNLLAGFREHPEAETTDWNGFPPSAWDKPSLAVIACNGGVGCVLWTAGPAVAFEMSEGGLTQLADLGLDDAPDGISVWEGKLSGRWTSYGDYGPEFDSELSGVFREPDRAEWEAIRANTCPWSDKEWGHVDLPLPEIGVTQL